VIILTHGGRRHSWLELLNLSMAVAIVPVANLFQRLAYKGVEEHRALIDPNNRLLAFQTPRRLEAEFVRDNALFVAGLLNLDLGGPSAHPERRALPGKRIRRRHHPYI